MSGWRSLVVGVDFTPCAASALRQAIRIAGRHQAALQAVHVIDKLVVMDLEEALTPYQADVRAGLVLGAHGTSPPERGAGTLAAACVRKARSSVLLVKEPHAGPFTSVVACVDFSATSRKALEQAVRMAAQDGAALHVLHVFHGPWHTLHYMAPTPQASPDYQKQYRDGLLRRLEAFCEPLRPAMAPLAVRYEIADYPGHGRGITEFVERIGGDLVVLGTRGRTNLRDMLLGSTAERVVRDAPCSILAVKPQGSGHPRGRA